MFEFRNPVAVIRDPQIFKLLANTHFKHFTNHRVVMTENIDPMFSKILPFLKDDNWKGA